MDVCCCPDVWKPAGKGADERGSDRKVGENKLLASKKKMKVSQNQINAGQAKKDAEARIDPSLGHALHGQGQLSSQEWLFFCCLFLLERRLVIGRHFVLQEVQVESRQSRGQLLSRMRVQRLPVRHVWRARHVRQHEGAIQDDQQIGARSSS